MPQGQVPKLLFTDPFIAYGAQIDPPGFIPRRGLLHFLQQKIVHGAVVQPSQPQELLRLRIGRVGFPAGDRLPGNAQKSRKLLLGIVILSAKLFQFFSQCHGRFLLFRFHHPIISPEKRKGFGISLWKLWVASCLWPADRPGADRYPPHGTGMSPGKVRTKEAA